MLNINILGLILDKIHNTDILDNDQLDIIQNFYKIFPEITTRYVLQKRMNHDLVKFYLDVKRNEYLDKLKSDIMNSYPIDTKTSVYNGGIDITNSNCTIFGSSNTITGGINTCIVSSNTITGNINTCVGYNANNSSIYLGNGYVTID